MHKNWNKKEKENQKRKQNSPSAIISEVEENHTVQSFAGMTDLRFNTKCQVTLNSRSPESD